MALLKCPECGNMVSDKASACPECGCPIEDIKAAQTPAPKKKHSFSKKRLLAVIISAVILAAAVFGIIAAVRYQRGHASQILHDWTFVSLVYTENGEQKDALDTASFTDAGQSAPTFTANKDGTYTLTALGTEYSGKWTRYSDEQVAQLDNVRQAYNLENSQGVQITAMIQDDGSEGQKADAITVMFTTEGTQSSSEGSTEAASANDYYAFLFERTGN